jgi:hypothetical protein
MIFNLSIELGTAAMQTTHDVADALRSAALDVEDAGYMLVRGMTGAVRDINGNTVGVWMVTP